MKLAVARWTAPATLALTLGTLAVPAGLAAQKHPKPPAKGKVVTTKDGLKIEILAEGSGPGATAGQTVSVHYTGWLTDGKQFDSSRKPGGQPFKLVLGRGKVIRGWDEGLVGMKKGGHRKLTIPPQLGYGEGGYPPVIPPNATLLFDVEMMDIK